MNFVDRQECVVVPSCAYISDKSAASPVGPEAAETGSEGGWVDC